MSLNKVAIITENKGDSIIKQKKQKRDSKKADWQHSLASAIRDPAELLQRLELSDQIDAGKVYLPDNFKLLVPVSYVERMQKGDWNDPLLKQVLPTELETKQVAGFVADPVGDLKATLSSGILHKYQGRVLLISTGACPVHCRYCFRQHFPYADFLIEKENWQNTRAQIMTDSTIHEVILSGGDPLVLSDDRLRLICQDITSIPHVKTIRFHTRVPIFLPERINNSFLEWAGGLDINKVMVIHSNHANEIDDNVAQSLQDLRQAGFTLLNQSVLLKGVNDNVSSLQSLSMRLFDAGVLPYYLHQLDKVAGASHFEVSRVDAGEIMSRLKAVLPGYLVPKYVEEISGKRSKQAIV